MMLTFTQRHNGSFFVNPSKNEQGSRSNMLGQPMEYKSEVTDSIVTAVIVKPLNF